MRKVILSSLWLGPVLGAPHKAGTGLSGSGRRSSLAHLLCLGVKRCFPGAWLASQLDSCLWGR